MAEIDAINSNLMINQMGLFNLNRLVPGKNNDKNKKTKLTKTPFLNLLKEESASENIAGADSSAGIAGAEPPEDSDITSLADDLHSTGDALKNRPFPEEIAAYKRAVRRFVGFVVKNGFEVTVSEGIKNKYKDRAGKSGNKNSDWGERKNRYSNIEVINKKLETLAASILSGQIEQLRLLERINEINGLVINLAA